MRLGSKIDSLSTVWVWITWTTSPHIAVSKETSIFTMVICWTVKGIFKMNLGVPQMNWYLCVNSASAIESLHIIMHVSHWSVAMVKGSTISMNNVRLGLWVRKFPPENFWKFILKISQQYKQLYICLHRYFLSAFTAPLVSSSALIITVKHCF